MIRQIGIFGVTEWIVVSSVRGFSVDEWWERPGGANPVIWIVGHILSSRRILEEEELIADADESLLLALSEDQVAVAARQRDDEHLERAAARDLEVRRDLSGYALSSLASLYGLHAPALRRHEDVARRCLIGARRRDRRVA